MSNCAGLAGHVTVEDRVVIGGIAGVHQFVKVGRNSMIGGLAKVVQDIPPFVIADGQPARVIGLNSVGLSRAGMSDDVRRELKKAFRILYRSGLNLGQAIAKYAMNINRGFKICAAFEIKPELIGGNLEGVPILDYETIVDYVEDNEIDIGIICVNRGNAQEVADKLSFAGAKGIWNFALTDLEVPKHVALESVHLSDTLHALAYHMNDIKKVEAQEKEKAKSKSGQTKKDSGKEKNNT